MKSGPFFKRRNALDTKRSKRPQTTTKVDDCRIFFLLGKTITAIQENSGGGGCIIVKALKQETPDT